MKVAILAGGLGTRISEETSIKPKPMVEIGEEPILWHIMKIYSQQGFNDFIVCLGYKGYYIKNWFFNYYLHQNDVTIDLKNNSIKYLKNKCENWIVTLLDTGACTMTGGRIKKLKEYVNNQTFMATYGDGLGDVNLKKLLDFHKSHGKIATLTSVVPEGRFGALEISDDKRVTHFAEKNDNKKQINSGFFVFEPGIFDYIEGDLTTLEKEPFENLAKDNNLMAYHHDGFWKPMDSMSDKNNLEKMWNSNTAPWKIWN